MAHLLRQAVDESGLKQTDIAQRLRVTRGRISQILKGGENLTLNTIDKFLAVLGKRLVIASADIKPTS